MKIHLYALCWNEADILGFFFRHYDPWVDRYFIFDDGSTDGSIEIMEGHPKVDLRKLSRKAPDSFRISQVDWLSEAWKESRGKADWVVIVDMDELLFAPKSSMRDLLEQYKLQGITQVPALGFEMLSEEFPGPNENLVKTRTWGIPTMWMSKPSIINPDAIKESNFIGGRHMAFSSGRIKLPPRDELRLYHYKFLEFERTFKKKSSIYENFGAADSNMITNLSRQVLRDQWDNILKSGGDVSTPKYSSENYPYLNRWWRFKTYHYIKWWLRRIKRFARNPIKITKRLMLAFTPKDDNQYR